MSSAIWGMGFAIVDARRKKLMKRLVATPMPRHYYLLSFALSRLLLLVVEVGVLLGFGAWVFHVPVRGSLLDIAVLCVVSSLAFGAIGLLLSSRAQTMEAASGLMNLVMMPMWILSGVFFSAQRFPDVLQPVIRALPAYRSHRCPTRQYAAGSQFCPTRSADGDSRRLDDRLFHRGVEDLPLAVSRCDSGLPARRGVRQRACVRRG